MILFKPEHVAPILDGRKTQTRRLGKKRWNVGAVHQARTKMLDPETVFARLHILDVRRELVTDCSVEDAHAEGYPTLGAYLAAFYRINRVRADAPAPLVWVVEFEVADV